MYRVHEVCLYINRTWFNELWIDSHYEKNHGESINDELILKLVCLLGQKEFAPQKIGAGGFHFFASDLVLAGKLYRLIWLIPPDESYLGVRNAYRRTK